MGRVLLCLTLVLCFIVVGPASALPSSNAPAAAASISAGSVTLPVTGSVSSGSTSPLEGLGTRMINGKSILVAVSPTLGNFPDRDRRGDPDENGNEWRDNDEGDGPDYQWLTMDDFDEPQDAGIRDDDQNVGPFDLGFDVPFFGNNFNSIRMCSNGWASFTSQSTMYQLPEQNLPSGNYPENLLAVAFSDWYAPAGGGTYWFATDGAVAVASWENHAHISDNDVRWSFQVQIYPDGKIIYMYHPDNLDQQIPTNALVGWQNQDRNAGFAAYFGNDDYLRQEAGRAIAFGPEGSWIQFDGPGILVRPEALDFGEVYIGQPEAIAVMVRNNGREDLVIQGLECDEDAFVLPGFDQEVVLGSGERLDTEVNFNPDAEGDFAADIRVLCNAENADNGVFVVSASGVGLRPPDIAINPDAIEDELETGETNTHDVTVTNDGGADFDYTTEIEITGEPERDANARGLRGVNGRNAGPARDDIEDLEVLVFTDGAGWGGQHAAMEGAVMAGVPEDQITEVGSGQAADIDLDPFNVIVWVCAHGDNYYAAYSNNRERFEEWVANGGVLIGNKSNGSIGNPVWTLPGDVAYMDGNSNNRNLREEDCDLANPIIAGDPDDDGDDLRDFIDGSSNNYGAFNRNDFMNNGDISNQQIFFHGEDDQNRATIITWDFGRGHVLGQSLTTSAHWYWWNQGWDQNFERWFARNQILWAAWVMSPSWVSVEPTEGTVAAGGEEILTVTLNAEGLIEGNYTAIVHILNEEDGLDYEVAVDLFVHGAPDINVEWAEENGYPNEINWNAAYPDLFNGFPYEVPVTILNEGTAELVIDGIEFTDGAFSTADNGQNVIAPNEELQITVALESAESGVHEGDMEIFSNDPDQNVYRVRVVGETGAPPEFFVDPGSIETELNTGEVQEHNLLVRNNGEAPLRFMVETLIVSEPQRDADARLLRSVDGHAAGPNRDPGNPGELLAQFGWNRVGVNNLKAGIAWDPDNELMLVNGYSPNWMGIMDPADGYRFVREWQPANVGNPMGAAWYDGVFYVIFWANNWLGKYDIDGNFIGRWDINVQTTSIAASMEEGVILIGDNQGNRDIHVYEPEGARIATIARGNYAQFIGQGWQRSLLWVDQHPDGQLWMNTPGHIWQMHVDTDNWTVDAAGVDWAPANLQNQQEWDGLGHDGHNLYYGPYGLANWRVYDDGNTESYWLLVAPEEGSLNSGEETNVVVTLNADGLIEGQYMAEVQFFTNDPNANPAVVNVDMFVHGAPDLAIEWEDEIGFPNEINWNSAYPDLFNNFAYEVPVTLINEGTAELVIDGIEFTNEFFSSPDNGQNVIAPDEELVITVVLESNQSGVHEGEMEVFSNDPDQGTYRVRIFGETGNSPQFVVNPGSIETELNTGESEDHNLVVRNSGEAPLRFTIETEVISEPERDDNSRSLRSVDGRQAGPQRDDLGDAIGQFQGNVPGGQYKNGCWDYDNEWLWENQYQNPFGIWAYDPADNFAMVRNFNLPGAVNPMDIAYLEGIIYVMQLWNPVLMRYDVNGQNLGNINLAQHTGINGVAASRELGVLFAAEGPGDPHNLDVFDLDGARIARIGSINPLVNNTLFRSIEWVDKHPDGELWVGTNGRAFQIDVDTDDWTFVGNAAVASFATQSQNEYSMIAHDGHNLWVSQHNSTVINGYDDGISEAYWLLVEPMEGELAANEEMNVVVTLNAEGLIEGPYVAELNFFTNDPNANPGVVNIDMFVHGAPDIAAEWSEDFGYPDFADWNMAYADLFTGTPYPMTFTIINQGTADLVIDGIQFTEASYTSPDDGQNVLGPDEEMDITVNLQSDESGVHEADMVIISNDPDMNEYIIALQGEPRTPPSIDVNPRAIEDELFTGETSDWPVRITNDGDAPLRWWTEIEIFEGGRDDNARSLRGVDGAAGPQRDDPGEVLNEYQIDNFPSNCGLAWDPDEEVIWGYNNNNGNREGGGSFWVFDPNQGQIVRTYDNILDHRCCLNLWEGRLYLNGSAWNPNSIYVFDLEGNQIEEMNVGINLWGGEGVHFTISTIDDDPYFFIRGEDFHGGDQENVNVYTWPDLQQVGRINDAAAHNDRGTCHVMWIDSHRDGQLWVDGRDQLYQLSVNTDDWSCELVQTFGVVEAPERAGLCHDGHDIWRAVRYWQGGGPMQNFTMLQQIDDDNAEANWISCIAEEGEIPGGEFEDMIIHLDAAGLVTGRYEADVHILNNDPQNNDVAVNVVLDVQGAPDIFVEWEIGMNIPEIDWNAYFEDLFTGGPYVVPVTVKNEGTDVLIVEGVECDNQLFTADPSEFQVEIGDEVVVNFTLNADEDGVHEGTMTFFSNDPDQGDGYDVTVRGETFAPPIADVTPNAIESFLRTGETDEQPITITNDGDALLRWTTEIEVIPNERDAGARSLRSVDGRRAGPQRDPGEPGELIAQFDGIDINNVGQYSSCVGWDPENEQMWVTNYSTSQIAAYTHDGNYANFRETLRIQQQSMDGSFVGDAAWIMPWSSNVVNKFNAEGQNIGNWQAPNGLYGLGWDSEDNWLIAMGTDMVIRIYQLDDDYNVGEQIGTIAAANHTQFHGGVANYGLEWVGAHRDTGPLWMYSNNNGQIHQIAVDTENWNCTGEVQAFSVNPANGGDQPYSSVAHDGEFLWASCQNQATIRIYEDGVAEIHWLELSAEEGVVEGHDAQDIFVMLNAEGLNTGIYEAVISFFTNDPNEARRRFDVSVTLEVEGAGDLLVEWEIMDNNTVDWTQYPDIYVNAENVLPVTISNEGTDVLHISRISSDQEAFRCVPEAFDLEIDAELVVDFIFQAAEVGHYEGTMTIFSDDPDDPEHDIALVGDVVRPPVVGFDPEDQEDVDLEDALLTGETAVHTFDIVNSGDAVLNWTSEVILVEPEERDAESRSLRTVDGKAAGPQRDDPGELLGQFVWNRAGQQIYKAGIAYDWDNEVMALTAYSPNWVAIVDPENDHQVIREWQPAAGLNPMGCTWLDGTFYAVVWANMFLYRFDVEGNNLGNWNINVQATAVTASVENEVIIVSDNAANRALYVYNADGERLATMQPQNWMQYTNNQMGRSLLWVDKHPEGQLWMNTMGHIWQMHVNTDDWQCDAGGVDWVPQNVVNPQEWDGLGHDGHNLYYGCWGIPQYRIYDDGQTELYWYAYDPTEGSIEPNERQEITITLDATGLLGGVYTADLNILNNDPFNRVMTHRTVLTVTGVAQMEPTWEIGFPEEIDWNAYHQDLFTGGPYTVPVTIENVGTDLLIIDGIECENQDFYSVPDQLQIEAGDEVVVDFILDAAENGVHEGSMLIVSNDPDGDMEIFVRGETFDPPIAGVEVGEGGLVIDEELVTGELWETDIAIRNTGDALLRWWTDVEEVEQGRDDGARSLRSVDGRNAGPQRDPGDPGELIAQFAGPNQAGIYCSPVGYDEDDNLMFFTNYNNGRIDVWTHNNYADFEQVRQFQTPNPMDGGWYEGQLYICNLANAAALRRFDAEGNALQDINMGFQAYGVAFDTEEHWMFVKEQAGNQPLHVYSMNGNEPDQRIGTIGNWSQFNGGNVNMYAFEWVAAHPDGQLWVGNYNTRRLYQIHVDTENWQADAAGVNFDAAITQGYDAACHDGEFMWVAGQGNANVRIYEDGVSEMNWLDIVPEEGTVSSEDEFGFITVTLSAIGIDAGVYQALLTIFTNDPNEERNDFVVDITLTVIGASAIYTEPIAEPIVNAAPVVFADTYLEEETVLPVMIENVGTEILHLEDISWGGNNVDDFSTTLEAGGEIEPGASMEATFTFAPQDIGERTARLTLDTDAENVDEGIVWWDLVGLGQTLPEVGTEPSEEEGFTVFMAVEADPEVRTLTIFNNAGEGADNLDWDVWAEVVEEDERDSRTRSLRTVGGNVGPMRDAAGDSLMRIELNHNGALGISRDYDNDIMWVDHTDQTQRMTNYWTAYAWNGEEITDVPVDFEVNLNGAFMLGGCYYDGTLYAGVWANAYIARWDLEGNRQGDINTGFIPMGIAVDWERGLMFSVSYPDVALHVLDINDNFQQIQVIQNFLGQGGNGDFRGRLSWAPEHLDGHLWASRGVQNIPPIAWAYQVNITENWEAEIVQEFQVISDVRSPGLCNDGRNLWVGNNASTTILIYDDGPLEGPPWLTIEPDEGTTEPGGQSEVTLTFDASELEADQVYEGVLVVKSNDPAMEEVRMPVILSTQGMPQEHWVEGRDYVRTESSHSILVTNVTFEDEEVRPGWEVGVFTPGDVLSGAGVWIGGDLGFPVYGAENDNGQFENGQAMSFRIWDRESDTEYPAVATVEEGDLIWIANNWTVLSLAAALTRDLTVNFDAGWNLISINVTPTDEALWANDPGPEIVPMMAQLRVDQNRHHVILMKNERGNFYAPAIGNFNNIPYWNLTEGYQVRMDEDVEATWNGTPIEYNAPIEITAGWNMIAYFPTYELNARPASGFRCVAPIIDDVVIAKDAAGNFMIPSRNFSNMAQWRETQGYQINVRNPVTLRYLEEEGQAAADVNVIGNHWAEIEPTGANMSVLISKFVGVTPSEGDQVAAMVGSRIVGVGTVTGDMCGLAVWGDDQATETVEGLKEGEAFTLRYFDADKVVELDLEAEITTGKGLVYKTDEFTVANASTSSLLPKEYYLAQNYPNPFNATTRFAYGLPEASHVTIRVYDLAGRAVATLTEGDLEAGHHSAIWNAGSAAAGIYLVKMESPTFNSVRKVTLVK